MDRSVFDGMEIKPEFKNHAVMYDELLDLVYIDEFRIYLWTWVRGLAGRFYSGEFTRSVFGELPDRAELDAWLLNLGLTPRGDYGMHVWMERR